MRKLVIFVGVLVVFYYIGIGFTNKVSGNLGGVGDGFIQAVGYDRHDLAYNMSTQRLKNSMTQEQFSNYLKTLGIDKPARTRWINVVEGDTQGYLEGNVILVDDNVVVVRIDFAKERQGNVDFDIQLGMDMPMLEDLIVWKVDRIERTN